MLTTLLQKRKEKKSHLCRSDVFSAEAWEIMRGENGSSSHLKLQSSSPRCSSALSHISPMTTESEVPPRTHTLKDVFCPRCTAGVAIFQKLFTASTRITRSPLLCNSTRLPCDMGYAGTSSSCGSPLICASSQRGAGRRRWPRENILPW